MQAIETNFEDLEKLDHKFKICQWAGPGRS